jgi:hypothetical protein
MGSTDDAHETSALNSSASLPPSSFLPSSPSSLSDKPPPLEGWLEKKQDKKLGSWQKRCVVLSRIDIAWAELVYTCSITFTYFFADTSACWRTIISWPTTRLTSMLSSPSLHLCVDNPPTNTFLAPLMLLPLLSIFAGLISCRQTRSICF